MRRIFVILLSLISICMAIFVSEGCDSCGDGCCDYEVSFDSSWRVTGKDDSTIDSGYFNINGTHRFDKVCVCEGETLGNKLPDVTKISTIDLEDYGFTIYYWYFLLNNEKVIVDSTTIFSEENLGVKKGTKIPLKIYYTSDWSPNI